MFLNCRHGGIIPPIAQQLHRENIEGVVKETFDAAAPLTIADIDAIAVTTRPGLTLSLLVGTRYAKHLARTHKKPLIPIHHMEAHALTARIDPSVQYPFLCLLASGGHCLLTIVRAVDNFQLLGESLDDAPGEAFDKIARRMKLRNLPAFEWLNGGQAIETAASLASNPDRYDFPLPLARQRNCQFSFAGLKNTAKRHIDRVERELQLAPDDVIPDYADFSAGYLRAIARHICHRTQRAIEWCEQEDVFALESAKRQLIFSGGVACNNYLYGALQELALGFGYEVHRPPHKWCTDNGLMIAWNGVERWLENEEQYRRLDIDEVETHPKCALGVNVSRQVEHASIACKWAKLTIYKKKSLN